MKYRYLYSIFALSVLFASCNNEDTDENVLSPERTIKIASVELNGFESGSQSRASYTTDYATTFVEGDRLGLILIDAEGKQTGNVPFIYTASEWTNAEVYYSPKIEKVIAYYPYNASLPTEVTTVEALENTIEIKADQSTDFVNMDLLVDEIEDVSENLDINFNHAFSLLSLSACSSVTVDEETFNFNIGMENVSLTIGDVTYTPYQTNGSNLWILKDNTSLEPELFKYTYTVSGEDKQTKTVSNTVTTASGTWYALPFASSGSSEETTVSVGDFYCTSIASGKSVIIPGNVASIPEGLTCKGIVFHTMNETEFETFKSDNGLTDNADYLTGYNGKHGWILSITAGQTFGMANDDNELVKNALTDYLNQKDKANGYAITQVLKTKAADSSSGITFNALSYHMEKASSTTTDWYTPSFHELKYLIRGSQPETASGDGMTYINNQLEKVSGQQLAGSIPSVTYINEGGTGFCLMQADGAENGWHGIPGNEVYRPICAF